MIGSAFALSILVSSAQTAHRAAFAHEIDAAIASAKHVYPVPKALVLAVIAVESDFDPTAVSRAGAVGLMQLTPRTARRLGLQAADLVDPERNALGGVRLLAVLLRHYRGDVISALVAYNAHPRRPFAPVPQNGETPAYVRRVLSRATSFCRLFDECVEYPHVRPPRSDGGTASQGH